jgi:hypothetical protein
MQVLTRTYRKIADAVGTGASAGLVVLTFWTGLVAVFALPITLGWLTIHLIDWALR